MTQHKEPQPSKPSRNIILEQKQQRMRELLNLIKKEENANIDKLCAAFAWKTGVATSTVMKYLRELVNVGLVTLDEVKGEVHATR